MSKLERELTKCVEQMEKTGKSREVYIEQLRTRLARLEGAAREYLENSNHPRWCSLVTKGYDCECGRNRLHAALEDNDG